MRTTSWVVIFLAGVAGVGRAAERGPMPREVKPQWQRMLMGEDAKRAAELEKRIEAAEEAERWDEALKLAEELLALRVRVQGADHWQAINSSLVAADLRQPRTAAERRRLREADGLIDQAKERFGQARYPDAVRLTEQALGIRKAVLGDQHPKTAGIRNYLGLLDYSQGRYAEAEPLLREVPPVIRAALGDGHPTTAAALNNLAVLYKSQGRYVEAEPLYREALAIRRAALGDRHLSTATSLNNLASLYKSQARYTEAEPLLREALAIQRAADGNRGLSVAGSLNNLAGLYEVQGRYVEAEPLYREALAIRRAALGDRHLDTATILNNLAGLYETQDRYAEAEPLYREALAICRAALGDRNAYTATCLNNLGVLYRLQGRSDAAEPLYRDALAARKAALGDRHPDTAASLTNLALLYESQGRSDAAEPLLREALAIDKAAFGERHPATASSLNHLARLYYSQGRSDAAEPLLIECIRSHEASRLGRASGLERAVGTAGQDPYPLLAVVSARLGRPTAAYAALEADLARGLLDELATRGGAGLTAAEEGDRAGLAARLAAIQDRVFKLAIRADLVEAERKELATLAAERQRTEDALAALAARLSRRAVAGLADVQAALGPDAALVAWMDKVWADGRVQEHWACVVRRTGDPRWEPLPGAGLDGKWSKDDDQLLNRYQAALRSKTATPAEIARLAAQVRAQRVAPIEKNLAGVKRLFVVGVNWMAGIPVELLVGPDIQVEYVPSGTFVARAQGKPKLTAQAFLLAVGDPVFPPADNKPRPLPPGGLLVEAVVPGGAAERELKAGDVLMSYGGIELAEVDALGKAIEAHAKDVTVAVKFWRVTDKGEAITKTADLKPGRLGVNLAKENARTVLARRAETDAAIARASGSGRVDPKTGKKEPWTELPGTAVELESLRKTFGDKATILSRSDASEQRLEAMRAAGELRKYRYLHFATHGLADPDRAFASFLALSQDKLPKYEGKPGEVAFDGELSAREVLGSAEREGWKLDCDLVTLSACESGLGRSGGGDGLLGFSQAFLVAGARSVCLSLWKVDDTATALLMDRFYRNLLGKRDGLTEPMTKAAALREAKAWLRELTAEEALELDATLRDGVTRGKGEAMPKEVAAENRLRKAEPKSKPFDDPRYWAAFILVGDPD